MFAPVDTRNPQSVEAEVLSTHDRLFGSDPAGFVSVAFRWAAECFQGRRPGYQAIDARYHDFEHTLQGTLCLARILEGRQRAGALPRLTQNQFHTSLLAILFHDTGYLKEAGDNEGTGAKYTLTHVARSIEFASTFLREHGCPEAQVELIRNMIRCTGLSADVRSIPFLDDLERLLGFALATADLLGQMAALDYAEKLPFLYLEFAEAAQHDTRDAGSGRLFYASPEELIRNTPRFWRSYVLPRLTESFGGLHRFLNQPYPNGPNAYLDQVERNITKLEHSLGM